MQPCPDIEHVHQGEVLMIDCLGRAEVDKTCTRFAPCTTQEGALMSDGGHKHTEQTPKKSALSNGALKIARAAFDNSYVT